MFHWFYGRMNTPVHYPKNSHPTSMQFIVRYANFFFFYKYSKTCESQGTIFSVICVFKTVLELFCYPKDNFVIQGEKIS